MNGKAIRNGEWPEVMTACVAWQYLGISRNTLYEALRRGDIPHWRVGRQYLIAKIELDKRLKI